MDELKLGNWLKAKKRLQHKSARDVISRCRRVEREFGISLVQTIKTQGDVDKLIERLDKESASLFASGTKTVFAAGVIRRALRLFGEFVESNQQDL